MIATESILLPELDLAITVGTTFPPANVHSLVNTSCPSINCTFPVFETLGLCHTCDDISGEIRSYRLSDTLDNPYGCCSNHTLVDQNNQTCLWADDQYLQQNTTTYGGAANDTFHFTLLQAAGFDQNAKSVAIKCELYPCIKECNSSIKSADLTEELINTIPISFSGSYPGLFELTANRTLRNGVWEDCTVDPTTKYLPDDCLWYFSSMDSLGAQLATALAGQDMIYAGTAPAGSTVARKLWNDESASINSVNAYFGDLADVITATIRNTGNKNISSSDYPVPIRGMAQVTETCIAVRWKWLSFLVVMSRLTLLFWLFICVYYICAVRSPPWKSSSLALLFCSLDSEIKDSINGYPTKDAMAEVSKESLVRLFSDGQGKVSLEKVSC